ncbi:glutathione hydrolase 3-like isoform X2 [Salvia miltiorrhiza]|uniref:glutathione hydrolase 3-like isoform X2 n=1 Tax=Salvia miltiorrhiza TaxID=226208 RepID=UPI0025AD1EC2|nr:glutathione hydrolase 3-like isoform X2 [Salvia miltiorrhiza]
MAKGLEASLIATDGNSSRRRRWSKALLLIPLTIALACFFLRENFNLWEDKHDDSYLKGKLQTNSSYIVESQQAVVAADDGRCSEIGVMMLEKDGHAVDAAVATALCLGVVSPMSSGIGGGAFMVVRSSSSHIALAIDMRETAPAAASQNMYEYNAEAKSEGVLSMGVPGEIAGLHAAWLRFGKLPWKTLFEPAIRLAKEGFIVSPYVGSCISKQAEKIMNDPGLRKVYAPNGKLLKSGATCYNEELGNSLRAVAEQGAEAFYNGTVGERLIRDVREAGGILTMDDLRNYEVRVTSAVPVHVMGYEILGMPPPSSGTVGISLVLNILASYGSLDAVKGPLGLHRLVEALKHMFAIRMDLGDPDFENISKTVSDMLSPSFAKSIKERIFDNTTFPPEYYMHKWSQLVDHGTSHFCIVDSARNAVSMTSTVNSQFGGGVLSPSTGIVLNNEMDDFSVPTDLSHDKLPPAPTNFIKPNKRPLSSMSPIVVLKDKQLVGVIGGSGGLDIIPGVIQVFINHFLLVQLIPNVVSYENWTVVDGEHIELSEKLKKFLRERGHQLQAKAGGAICQLVVQNLTNTAGLGRKVRADDVLHGVLTAISDPRKGGQPAAM